MQAHEALESGGTLGEGHGADSLTGQPLSFGSGVGSRVETGIEVGHSTLPQA